MKLLAVPQLRAHESGARRSRCRSRRIDGKEIGKEIGVSSINTEKNELTPISPRHQFLPQACRQSRPVVALAGGGVLVEMPVIDACYQQGIALQVVDLTHKWSGRDRDKWIVLVGLSQP